jgi:hypothetical protein
MNNNFTVGWWKEVLDLDEYSNKVVNTLVDKFKQEEPSLETDVIKAYINRFDQIKSSPKISNKDITKYSWKELENIINSNQPKRIKAGKINDGEPENADLVYNQNELRVYVGKDRKACIKYGNGYSFCISARGGEGEEMYTSYRYEEKGTPYFIFDDTKSSKKDENGKFIDDYHLLVIFIYEDREMSYSVTKANNKGGEEYFENWDELVKAYPEQPKLKFLKNIIKPVDADSKEKAEYDVRDKYNSILNRYTTTVEKNCSDIYEFYNAEKSSKIIDDILSGKIQVYQFKAEVIKNKEYHNHQRIIGQQQLINPEEINKGYDSFTKLILLHIDTTEDKRSKEEILSDFKITSYRVDNISCARKYYEGVKKIADRYRSEIGKLNLLKENLKHNNKLNESQTATIGEFVKYAIKNLGIQKPPRNLTLSYDNNKAKDMSSFGYFDPNNNKIWIYCANRNMADILRTLAHELVHRKQDEDGKIDNTSGVTGSEIENEANAQAGILLRDFGKQNKDIYEVLLREGVYGNYLFGDKESGVSILWYDNEKEEDTLAEHALFKLLKKYASSTADIYGTINLDHLIPILKILKKDYPEIADPKLNGETYIYRGTSIPKEKLNELMYGAKTEPYTKTYDQGIIIMNQMYSSRRKVQSWSINYNNAATFAASTAETKGGVPVIMRAKAKNAELFFKPEFMDKLSSQLEDETFSITNPIPADVMVLENYKDDFENIEAGYQHTKQK